MTILNIEAINKKQQVQGLVENHTEEAAVRIDDLILLEPEAEVREIIPA